MPLLVPYGNDQAPAVKVIERPALLILADQPQLKEQIQVLAAAARPFAKLVAMLLGQSHPSFEHVLLAPSQGRIAACGGSLVVRCVEQVVRVVLSHPLVEPPQGFTAQPLLALRVRLRLLVEVHAVLLSQSAHRVDKRHALALHEV